MAQASFQTPTPNRRGPLVTRPAYTIEHRRVEGLRYSPARPWLLAIAISSCMWLGIGWAVWSLVS